MRYRRLLTYAVRRWPALAAIGGLTLVCSAFAVVQPWPLKLLVDYALGDSNPPLFLKTILDGLESSRTSLLFAAAIASVGLYVLNLALDIGLTLAWQSYGERLSSDLSADLFHRLQRVSLLFHGRRPVGDSLSRLTGDAYCVYAVVQNLVISPVQNLLTLAIVGFIAWRLDPWLAVLIVMVAPVQAAFAIFIGPRLKRRAQQSRTAESSLLSFVHQTLTAIPLIQAFGTEERNAKQFRRLASDAVALSQRGNLLGNAYGAVNSIAAVLGDAIVLFVGAQQVLSGAITVGSLLVFLSYTRSMQVALGNLFSAYCSFKPLEANIDRVLEILDTDSGIRDAPNARPLPTDPAAGRGHVRFENVTFGYESGHPVLQGINLEARGEVVALVGPSGAGKSTLVSLIPRLFDPWEGRVIVDGMDLRDVQLSSLRARVALLLQDPFLLPLTVAENIAYGRPEANRDEVIAAAIAANADEFIRRLPEGYDAVLGEGGSTLSGGEKQRLAIARALLKDAPVLILDEPTSALDANTEGLLLEALDRLMAGRTTFIIAHRLSTIRYADRIVVLDKGQIVETGTHEELSASNGHYHRFHSLQFSSNLAASGARQ